MTANRIGTVFICSCTVPVAARVRVWTSVHPSPFLSSLGREQLRTRALCNPEAQQKNLDWFVVDVASAFVCAFDSPTPPRLTTLLTHVSVLRILGP